MDILKRISLALVAGFFGTLLCAFIYGFILGFIGAPQLSDSPALMFLVFMSGLTIAIITYIKSA